MLASVAVHSSGQLELPRHTPHHHEQYIAPGHSESYVHESGSAISSRRSTGVGEAAAGRCRR